MCPPVKGAEVQAGVGVETSRNIARLHVTAFAISPAGKLGTGWDADFGSRCTCSTFAV